MPSTMTSFHSLHFLYLENANKFLSQDGNITFSAPNISHQTHVALYLDCNTLSEERVIFQRLSVVGRIHNLNLPLDKNLYVRI